MGATYKLKHAIKRVIITYLTPTVRLWVFRHSGIRLRLRENDSCTQELTVQKLLSKTTGFAGGFGFHTGHR